jgi:hypothetical protein
MASGSPSRATQTPWNDGGGVRVEGEPAASGDGPRLEQRDRVCGAQWLDLMDHFAVQAQRDLAGRDDVQAWCFVQHSADQGGDGVDDVLAVVETDQDPAVVEAGCQ